MLDIGWEKCTETLLRHGGFTKCSNMCDRGLMGGRKKRDVPPPPRCSYNYNFEGATKKNGHCTWKRPYHPPWKLAPKPQKHRFGMISYIFIIAGLEPKLFVFTPSTQQQSSQAQKIGKFCHQHQPSICLCSKVRDRATTAFRLAPKW